MKYCRIGLLVASTLASCGGESTPKNTDSDAGALADAGALTDSGSIDAVPSPLTVALGPETLDLIAGESSEFTATITAPPDAQVNLTWKVLSATVDGLDCSSEVTTSEGATSLMVTLPARFEDVRCADELTISVRAAAGADADDASATLAVALPTGLGSNWLEVETPGNPVVPLSACPEWDCLGHTDPTIGKDSDGSLLLWFSAGGSLGSHPVIGKAKFQNGNFALSPSAAPVIDPQQDAPPANDLPWDYIRETVSVMHAPAADRWNMVYLGYATDYFTDPAIGLVQSSDAAGTVWPRAVAPIYEPTRPGGWDESFLTAPTGLLGSDGTWRIYFSGASTSAVGGKVGVLTSPDGVTWTPRADNPILDGRSGEWDESIIDCFVSFVGGRYLMWYSAFVEPLNASTSISIGLAMSEDGFTWQRVGAGPVLTAGTAGAWNDLRVLDGEVIVDSDGSLVMAAYGTSSTPPIADFPDFKPERLGLFRSSGE